MISNDMLLAFVWPDGTWCSPEEIEEFTHKSDDYFRLTMSTTIDELVAQLGSLKAAASLMLEYYE